MRAPDFGFCWAAFRWASGHSLTSVLRGSELTVGDFVRSIKQIIDLLRQLKIAAPEMQKVVDDALLKIDRGVITYSGATI
jgi:ATP-dependent RNA helicase HelY